MNGERLEEELRAAFDREVNSARPAQSLVDGVMPRLEELGRQQPWRRFAPRQRIAWALIPLAVLLLSGIAYASSSVIRELFMKLAPWVEHAGLSQELNLSQTVDGVTVRIERAYADSNAAVVGYTISGPSITTSGVGQRYFSRPGGLSIDGGPTLKSSGASGTVPGSQDVVGEWRTTDRLAVLATFDTSAVEGSPTELKVTLPIQVYDRVPVPDAGQATIRTFSFDFSIKFHAGTVINVGQTVEAAGVKVTLDKMVIAPWATRAVLRFPPEYDTAEFRPAEIVSLIPPGGQPVMGAGLFYGDFSSKDGEWTLNISELVFFHGLPPGIDLGVPENENGQVRPKGPWVFHFTVQ